MAVDKSKTENSIDDLRLEQTRLKQGLVARNTVLGYGYDMRMYDAWCARRRLASLPTTSETLSLYLTDLLSQGKKITTARRRKCAIAHEHRSRDLPNPATSEVIALLRGAQRIRAEKPRQMRPISVAQLRAMSGKLAGIGTDIAIRNRALLVIAFASALRRSNLAALTLADVEFCRQGILLSVEREKQDQEGKGRLIGLARGKHLHTDPVRVLRAWLKRRGRKNGPLFPALGPGKRGGTLDGEQISRIVKRSLKLIGVNPAGYGAHSTRAGFVTECGERGIAESLVAHQTGHRNMQTLRRYFRRSEVWRLNASASLGL